MKTTTKPKTLLQYAGFTPNDMDVNNSTLILIDFQNEYITGALPLYQVQESLRIAKELLNEFRSVGQPIIHVVHHSKSGAPLFDPDSVNVEIFELLKPINEEPTVVKTLPSAFTSTDLNKIIQDTGLTKLVFCGFMTHMCVSSTVRSSAELGYSNTVIANACTTRDLPVSVNNSKVISARKVHLSSLAAINDRFATVIDY